MKTRCGACGKEENVATITGGEQGFRLSLEAPWRCRNAKIMDGASGAMVTLCGDLCEERYGREVGFWEGPKP